MTFCGHILNAYESDERRVYKQAWFARCVICEERNIYSHQTFECQECHVYVHRRCWQLVDTYRDEESWSAFAAASVVTANAAVPRERSAQDLKDNKCPFDICEPENSGENCQAVEPVRQSPFVYPEGIRAPKQLPCSSAPINTPHQTSKRFVNFLDNSVHQLSFPVELKTAEQIHEASIADIKADSRLWAAYIRGGNDRAIRLLTMR